MGCQFLKEYPVGHTIKGFTIYRYTHPHSSSFKYVSVTEGPAFAKLGLARPDPLVVLHVLHNGTQEDLFHDLLWHQSQTDMPADTQILIPTLNEDRWHICHLPVSCNLPAYSGLLASDGKRPSEHFCQNP
ncbi:hypothetical protein TURU_088662 [Turdus rufiventris]|nr:hypothetical protein TURU_088662 [Turdus rufiventris]